MTIITPSSPKRRTEKSPLQGVIAALTTTLVLLVLLTAALYAHAVSVRHQATRLASRLEEARGENADLKSRLFALNDPTRGTEFLKEHGMVRDTRPQWVFASR